MHGALCCICCWHVCAASVKIRVTYRDGDAAFGQQCVETINNLIEGFYEDKVVVPLTAGVFTSSWKVACL